MFFNRYSSNKPVDTIVSDNTYTKNSMKLISDYDSMTPDPKAKAQLDLLCRLIGKSATSSTSSSGGNDIKLNLFNNEKEEL